MLKRCGAFLLALFFLVGSAVAEDTYLADEKQGLWTYTAEDFSVTIQRREDEAAKLIWYECDLKCSPQSPLMAVSSNPKKPGTKFQNPERIAQKYQLVFAVNDDYFGDRVYNKETPGITIRDGKILYKKTYKSGKTSLPNLDTMAIYRDGRIGVYQSKELTAEEYIERGAEHVCSFGPYLVREGTINPNLEGRYKNNEPRVAFGMIEPYHYVCVVVEGRHKKSKGVGLEWLAEKMRQLGAVEALNLDGGQTAALVFMGEKINTTGKFGAKANIRNLSGMLGVGTSEWVGQ
ncbi:MAG: phosphodiester glycosidase family protein [Clostridia bacterium]|nr:phosphodiester glycosidase family protein [Clostridia bacterium]